MAGPGGEIVGRVSVKVVPDTSKFAQELRAQLKKINDDFKVDVSLDTKGALAEFKALKRQIEGDDINANVKVNAKGLNSVAGFRKPLAGVASVLFSMQKALNGAAQSSQQLARNIIEARKATVAAVAQTLVWSAQMVRAVINTENARKAWQGLSKAVQAVGVGIRKIPELAQLARHLSDLALIGAYIRGIRLLNFAKSLTQIETYSNLAKKAMAGLRDATDRVAIGLYRIRNIRLSDVVNVIKRVGTSMKNAGKSVAAGVGRMLDSGISGIGKVFSSAFSMMANAAGSVGQSLAGMSRNMLLVAVVAAVIAPIIGLVAGLVAGLPSLLAAAGAGFAAVALGMDGIKQAASVFTPAVERMKASLSQTFKDGLTPIFERLNTVMPVLQDGLNLVAGGLINMTREFTNVVTSAQGMEQIRTILAGVGQFFTAIGPMVNTMTSAFLTLATAGAQSFGFLSNVLNNFGASFNEMTNRIVQSGAFTEAMRGMSQVLDAVLQGFTRVMEAGVIAMGQLGGPLATFINGFTDAFVALMPILTSVSGLLFNVLGTALSALAPVFTALAPVIAEISNTLGTLLVGAIQAITPILTPLAQIISTVLLTAFQAIQPILPVLVDLMMQLGTIIGGVLNQAMIALTPLLQMAGQFLAELFTALAPILPAIGELALAIIPPLIGIVLQLIPPLMQLAQLVFPLVIEIVKAAVPIILMIADALKTVIPFVINLASQIIGFLIPIITGLLDVIKSVFPNIQGIISGVMNVIKGVINFVMGIITGDWNRAWNGIKQILSGAWQAIKNAVVGGINLVIGIVTTLPGRILGAIGNLGGLLYNAGKSLLIGLWNGIASWVGELWGRVKGVVQGIRNFFPFSPAKVGPFSGKGYTTHSGKALIKDWAKGIEAGAPDAIRAVEDVMNSTNRLANAEWHGQITSDGFGNIGDRVAEALSGWGVQIDGNGMAKLVNKANRLQEVRRING